MISKSTLDVPGQTKTIRICSHCNRMMGQTHEWWCKYYPQYTRLQWDGRTPDGNKNVTVIL